MTESTNPKSLTGAEKWLPGGGKMGERIREFDWANHPLGPIEQWPPALASTLSICLSARFPMAIYWGAERFLLYNEAWRPILGDKHPWALGRAAKEVWPEIWDAIAPAFESVWTTGEATWRSDELLPMQRFGFTEECYFDYTFNPIRGQSGAVEGILNVVLETTYRVLNDRRATLLRELAASFGYAQAEGEACASAIAALATDAADIPFALIYLVEDDKRHARLVAATGLSSDHPAKVQTVELTADAATQTWPLAEATSSGRLITVDDLEQRFGMLIHGFWPEPVTQSVILPMVMAGAESATALLVAGVNPRHPLDKDYEHFFGLVGSHIATAITNARAFEKEKHRAAALAELDRAKTAFFSNVSHEFRTPLTLMLGPLEDALSVNEGLPANTREQIELAQRNGVRLLKLVNTLLDFSRIEAGRTDVSFEPIDLAAYTAELASVFRSAIEKTGVKLVVNCTPLPEAVYVDREMWEKIVLNLISNAFKFTFEGEIEVSLKTVAGGKFLLDGKEQDAQKTTSQSATNHQPPTTSHHVVLTVRDTGTGIPEAELPHLFERFHRVKGAKGRSYEGSGIGLSLVRELVRLHGGEVSVTSQLNHGSTFTVTIPIGTQHLPTERIGVARTRVSTALAANAYVEEALRWLPESRKSEVGNRQSEPAIEHNVGKDALQTIPSSTFPLPTSRILLADDNADMREYVRRLLAGRYEVTTVADGEEALATALQQPFDLVLTDVMMPKLDGFGLLRELRADERTRDLPVIMLSARAGEEARVEGLTAGADDYLIKPFSARELLARVESNLKLQQLRRESLRREQTLRQEAEEANRLKDEFLATISHELRTPLNHMLGWIVMLRSGRLAPDKVTEALATIERNARAQNRLIEDLLDVSRIITGKLRLELQPVALPAVVEAAVASARPAAEAKNVILINDTDSRVGVVSGDADRLQQVVWNLLSNAIKFTPTGGSVIVRLVQLDEHVRLTVTDTGEGIAPEFLPHVFDRFSQADGSYQRNHSGLGLGLAIVRHLVELHGGTVGVESAGTAQGATFTVTLPLRQVDWKMRMSRTSRTSQLPIRAEQSAILDPHSAMLTGMRVLVVDDEEDTRKVVAALLTEGEAEVQTAASSAEAIALLLEWTPDVIVADIGMPDEDGYEFIRRVRRREAKQGKKQTPAIAVTAYARTEDRLKALAAGYQQHLSKPVEPLELLVVVASLGQQSNLLKKSN
jgi:signal transduction histidine kinase